MEKIVGDRAKWILVITSIGSTPCPLEGVKLTLDSITLNEMSFGPEEELFIDAKGLSMPSPGQAWGTKAFLVDGAQAQPTGDEAFIRRVGAVPMRVIFEPKEGTDQPSDGIDFLSNAEIHHVVNYMRMGMWQPKRGGPWSHLRIGGMTRCWSPASTRRMSSWRGSWITSRTNMVVRLGRTRLHGFLQEWEPIATRTRPMLQISEDYWWEARPTTMKTAYRTRRSRTRTPKKAYTAVRSVVSIPKQAAEEAQENPKVAELKQRLINAYPRLFSGVANRNPPDRGRFGTARIKLNPNPKIYRYWEYQLQGDRAMKKLLAEFIERGPIEPSARE